MSNTPIYSIANIYRFVKWRGAHGTLVFMAHHAYVLPGPLTKSREYARAFCVSELALPAADIIELSYDHFSVEDARALADVAVRAPVAGDAQAIIVSAGRLFAPAQNALLKVFEEPPLHTTLILLVPSLGQLLPTLRSRLIALSPEHRNAEGERERLASGFLGADAKEREKMAGKIADAAKSDKEEVKQGARLEALALVEGLMLATHEAYVRKPDAELRALLSDIERLIPILHEASAPLKQVLEHLAIVTPSSLTQT